MIGGINYKVTKLYKVEWVGLEIWAFLSVAQHYTQSISIYIQSIKALNCQLAHLMPWVVSLDTLTFKR